MAEGKQQNYENDFSIFQAKMKELTLRNQSLQAEVSRLSSETQHMEGSGQRLQAEIYSLTENIRILENEKERLFAKSLQENESWSQRYEQLNNEICLLRTKEKEHKEQKQTMYQKMKHFEEDNQELRKQHGQLKLEIKCKDDEIKNFQEAQKIFEDVAQITQRELHQKITQLKEHNKALNAGKTEAEKQKRLKEDIIRLHDATIKQQQDTMEYFKQQYQQDLRERNSKIESLEKEKKDLTLRLVKLADPSANLTYNNPNIADLSDENRPTKLAEEFSELFDNEWTDAFEILSAEDEREKTKVMLNILEEANKLCHNATKDHTDAVRNGFTTLYLPSDLEVVKMHGIRKPAAALKGTPVACYKSLTANFDDLTNEHKKTVSNIRRFFEDKLSLLFRQESTKIINTSLPENMQNEESLQKYIQKCLQVCWPMCRHEPPVFIHFIEPRSDTPFDTNKYKPFTKTGKYVDYVVWPALYLHEDGPMLSKGVAQGRK